MTSSGRARLWIMSDLHQESPRLRYAPPSDVGCDVVVLAGDVHKSPSEAMAWARRTFEGPVVYVAGNHEYYGNGMAHEIREARMRATETPDMEFLENSTAVVAGVRFVGCTLWTDFDLDGPDRRTAAMRTGSREMSDFDQILLDEAHLGMMPSRLRPAHARTMHEESRRFLDRELARPFDGPTVVVTHHAPARGSIHERYAGDLLTACFVSDLEDLIVARAPALWVHGHVHDVFDYVVGSTRVVCNPRGYEKERSGFDPRLIVSV